MSDKPPLSISAAIAWLAGLKPDRRAARLTELLNENELDWNAELVTELRETGVWPTKEVQA